MGGGQGDTAGDGLGLDGVGRAVLLVGVVGLLLSQLSGRHVFDLPLAFAAALRNRQ